MSIVIASVSAVTFLLQCSGAMNHNSSGLPEVPSNKRSLKEQEVIRMLLRNYSNYVHPIGDTPMRFGTEIKYPVIINVTVWVLSLSSFDDVTMEFTAQLGFQQEWFDDRLIFNDSYFSRNELIKLASDQQLWIPDTFFQNEQRGHSHQIDQPNEFIKINSQGWVKYRKRLTMAFSCPMNLMLFPHDNQTCVIEFASYAYTTSDIILQWSSTPAVILTKHANDSLPKFSLTECHNEICTSKTATGDYSCLRIKFVLRREFSYFLLQLYIPSCMLVSVSCVSFWIDWRSAPARVPLTIVTLLTITTTAHGINANLPPVSYTKAIDIWIGACVVFIFGSLIEYAIVNYIGSNEEKKKAKIHGGEQVIQYQQNNFHPAIFMQHNDLTSSYSQASIPILSQKYESYGAIGIHENHLAEEEEPIGSRKGLRFRARDKKRKQREYRKVGSDSEEGTGDCFDRNEYVEFRQKQMVCPAEFRGRRERRISSWLVLSESLRKASRAEKIDIMSRILFPVGFAGFNVVYWSLYYSF